MNEISINILLIFFYFIYKDEITLKLFINHSLTDRNVKIISNEHHDQSSNSDPLLCMYQFSMTCQL
jgi:hypothetical protein